jgi:hypothetical protein
VDDSHSIPLKASGFTNRRLSSLRSCKTESPCEQAAPRPACWQSQRKRKMLHKGEVFFCLCRLRPQPPERFPRGTARAYLVASLCGGHSASLTWCRPTGWLDRKKSRSVTSGRAANRKARAGIYRRGFAAGGAGVGAGAGSGAVVAGAGVGGWAGPFARQHIG